MSFAKMFFANATLLVVALVGPIAIGALDVRPVRAGGGCACDKLPGEAIAAPSPSFDCKLAKTQSERAICADETLARLDDRLNRTYLKTQNALPAGRRVKLYTEELSWVRKRDLTCSMKETYGLRRCLAEMTITRIDELTSYIK